MFQILEHVLYVKKKPFIFNENVWLKREIENIDFCKCTICDFESDKNAFFLHLIEKHKEKIIDNLIQNLKIMNF